MRIFRGSYIPGHSGAGAFLPFFPPLLGQALITGLMCYVTVVINANIEPSDNVPVLVLICSCLVPIMAGQTWTGSATRYEHVPQNQHATAGGHCS